LFREVGWYQETRMALKNNSACAYIWGVNLLDENLDKILQSCHHHHHHCCHCTCHFSGDEWGILGGGGEVGISRRHAQTFCHNHIYMFSGGLIHSVLTCVYKKLSS